MSQELLENIKYKKSDGTLSDNRPDIVKSNINNDPTKENQNKIGAEEFMEIFDKGNSAIEQLNKFIKTFNNDGTADEISDGQGLRWDGTDKKWVATSIFDHVFATKQKVVKAFTQDIPAFTTINLPSTFSVARDKIDNLKVSIDGVELLREGTEQTDGTIVGIGDAEWRVDPDPTADIVWVMILEKQKVIGTSYVTISLLNGDNTKTQHYPIRKDITDTYRTRQWTKEDAGKTVRITSDTLIITEIMDINTYKEGTRINAVVSKGFNSAITAKQAGIINWVSTRDNSNLHIEQMKIENNQIVITNNKIQYNTISHPITKFEIWE